MSNFNANLRYIRKKLSISQEEVGSNIGVRGTTISNWENGVSEPDVQQLIPLCHYFGFSADVFLFENFTTGKLINDDYLSKFNNRFKSTARALPRSFEYRQDGDRVSLVNEDEQNFLWIVLQTLRQMDTKLTEVHHEVFQAKKEQPE